MEKPAAYTVYCLARITIWRRRKGYLYRPHNLKYVSYLIPVYGTLPFDQYAGEWRSMKFVFNAKLLLLYTETFMALWRTADCNELTVYKIVLKLCLVI